MSFQRCPPSSWKCPRKHSISKVTLLGLARTDHCFPSGNRPLILQGPTNTGKCPAPKTLQGLCHLHIVQKCAPTNMTPREKSVLLLKLQGLCPFLCPSLPHTVSLIIPAVVHLSLFRILSSHRTFAAKTPFSVFLDHPRSFKFLHSKCKLNTVMMDCVSCQTKCLADLINLSNLINLINFNITCLSHPHINIEQTMENALRGAHLS